MTPDATERLQVLCQQITQEQDPEKVLQLVQELNQLLDQHPSQQNLLKMIEEQLENPRSRLPSNKSG